MPALWPSQPCTRAVSISPSAPAAPLNRETAEALSAWAGEKSGALVYSGQYASGKQVWLSIGRGSHWRTMGQTMYQHSTAFADTLDRCFSACSEMLTPSLREAMFNPDLAQSGQYGLGAAGDCRV
ncbi:hypothetical protein MJK72_18850 [Klebsiella pneumoniae]|nr:hypothetical protein MJK72_18850 [Klebsiella pneumoniae]